MSNIFPVLGGGLTISRTAKPREETDCFKCEFAYVTPENAVTTVKSNNGNTYIQNGKGVFCMDSSKDKHIDIYDGVIVCNKFKAREKT